MTGADPHPDPHPELPDGVRLDASAALAGELAGDVGHLVDFLAVRLAGALPGAVDVKRRGLFGSGKVERVKVVAGDEHYELSIEHGQAVRATVGQAVNGVCLRRDPVPTGEWIRRLLTRLEAQAAQSSETAAALEGLI